MLSHTNILATIKGNIDRRERANILLKLLLIDIVHFYQWHIYMND